MQAADSGVQSALMNALMTNPDAQAALQRGLAMQGLSVDMQRLQQSRMNLLPPAAAAVADGSAAGATWHPENPLFASTPPSGTLRVPYSCRYVSDSS